MRYHLQDFQYPERIINATKTYISEFEEDPHQSIYSLTACSSHICLQKQLLTRPINNLLARPCKDSIRRWKPLCCGQHVQYQCYLVIKYFFLKLNPTFFY